jgi:hypothetical protein
MLAAILRPPWATVSAIVSPELLLDAKDTTTVARTNGRVTGWTDKSTNDRDFIGGDSTAAPYWNARDKSINFRLGQYLSMTSPFLAGLTSGCSIFMVARADRIMAATGTFFAESNTLDDDTLYYLITPGSNDKGFRLFVRRDNGFLPINLEASNVLEYPFTYISAQTFPDASGSLATKGFTCTGLCLDNDDTWLVGNDGRQTDADETYEASIVKVSKDGTTKLWELVLNPIYPEAESCQGVCIDPTNDSLWWCSYGEGLLRNTARDGTPLGEIDFAGNPCGVAYDARFDGFWANRQDRVFKYSRSGTLLHTIDIEAKGLSTADQCQLIGDELWLSSDESPGKIYRLDLTTEELSSPYYFPAAGTIEGLHFDGTNMWICNDSYMHGGTSGLNELLKYSYHSTDGYDLLASVENRTTATLYKNGAVVGTPDTLMNPMVANYTPNRVCIGAVIRTTTSQYLYGNIKLILVVAGAADQTTRERLEGILAWHCRIEKRLPTSHPYRYKPPRT